MGGRTEIEAEHAWGGIGAHGFGTVVGRSVWDKETVLSALVFDLQNPSRLERATQAAEGTAWVAAVFPLVVGLPSNTEGRAAQKLGEQLIQTLAAAREKEAMP